MILLKSIEEHKNSVNFLEFSPLQDLFVSASSDSTIKIFNLDGTLKSTLNCHRGYV